jgi:hypothetical protein
MGLNIEKPKPFPDKIPEKSQKRGAAHPGRA